VAYRPPPLVDLVPGNLGIEVGVPRSSSVSRGSSIFVEIPDCDTSLYTDGPGAIIFPQSAGSYGCVAPAGGIPHPSALVRYDGIAGGAAGTVITVDSANTPGKTMTIAGAPIFNQVVAGWAKRAMIVTQTASTGLRIPLDADGSWWDVGRSPLAKLLWYAVTASGGNRPFYSLAGTSIQLRILATGFLNLLTTAGSVTGTYDYRHGGTRTFHPFLVALKPSTQEIKVWTDKEVLTGVWTYASDLEKGPYLSGQAPPDGAWLGEDTWTGDKALSVFSLGKDLLTRLNWAVSY
jgi:hypothetical protein